MAYAEDYLGSKPKKKSKPKPKPKKKATRTPTELGQTTPTTKKGQKAKAKALQAPTPKKTRKASRVYGKTVQKEAEKRLRQVKAHARKKPYTGPVAKGIGKRQQFARTLGPDTPDKDYTYRRRKHSQGIRNVRDRPTAEEGFLQSLTGVNADNLSKTKPEDVAAAAATAVVPGAVVGKAYKLYKAARAGQAIRGASKVGQAAPRPTPKAKPAPKPKVVKPPKAAVEGKPVRLKDLQKYKQADDAARGIKSGRPHTPGPSNRVVNKVKAPRSRAHARASTTKSSRPASIESQLSRAGRRRIKPNKLSPSQKYFAKREASRAAGKGFERKGLRVGRTLRGERASVPVERLAPLGQYAATGGGGAAAAVGVAGQAKALVEDPGATLKRTAEAAPSFITAPIGALLNAGASGKRLAENVAAELQGKPPPWSSGEVSDPLEKTADEFTAFNEELAKTFMSADLDKISEATKEKYGLTPTLMLALATRPVTGRLTGDITRATRRGAEKVRAKVGERFPGAREKGRGRRRPETDEPQTVFPATERRRNRRRESERAALATNRQEQLIHDTIGPIGKKARKVKGKQGVRGSTRRDFPENYAAFMAERSVPLDNPRMAKAWLREQVGKTPKGSPNRAMIEELIERYDDLVADPAFRGLVEELRGKDKFLRDLRKEKGYEDDASLYQPIGEMLGEIAPDEIVPASVRPITKAKTMTALKEEIVVNRSNYKALGGKLRKARKDRAVLRERIKRQTGKRRDTTEERIDILDAEIRSMEAQRKELGGAIREKMLVTRNRLTKAEREKVLAEAPNLPRDPAGRRAILREAAIEKARKRRTEETLPEYVRNVKKGMKERELVDEPMWNRHVALENGDVGNMNIARSYSGGRIPPTEKHRTGALLRKGNVDYTLATVVGETFERRGREMVLREHTNAFVRDTRLRMVDSTGKARTIATGPEWRYAEQTNQLSSKHNVLLPVQEFKRALARGDDEMAESLLRQSLKEEIETRALRGDPGKMYSAHPREAVVEFLAQMDTGKGGWKVLREAQRLSTRVLLGTSPAWFISQIPATSTMAVASVGPFALAREAAMWAKLPKQVRHDFMANVEAGSTAGLIPEVEIALSPRTVRSAHNTFLAFDRTRVGRTLKAMGTLEPLIAGNRYFEANLKGIVAAARVRKEVGGFMVGLGSLYRTQQKHLKALRKLSHEEQLVWYTKHPREAERIAGYVRDTMGSWQALTRYERQLGPLIAFYPFLRFSLRTVYRTFPKRHPIKAAILANLAAANADSLRRLLGPDASLTQYASTPLYLGEDGKPTSVMSLMRITPGFNVLLEAGVSPQTSDLGAFLKGLSPWLSSSVLPLISHDPGTGRPFSETEAEEMGTGAEGFINRMGMSGAALLSLPTGGRAIDAIVHGNAPKGKSSVPVVGGREDSDITKLYRAIAGGSPVKTYIWPFQPQSIYREQQAARLTELLSIVRNKPSNSAAFNAHTLPKAEQKELREREEAADAAQEEINRMLVEWGIVTKRKQERESEKGGESYGFIKYGNDGGDGGWYGSKDDEESNSGGWYGSEKKASSGGGWYD